MRRAVLRGRTLLTPYGQFRSPTGLGSGEKGPATLYSGSTPRGSLQCRGGMVVAEIRDRTGNLVVEIFEVVVPETEVRLQERTHALPKGGETTQYTVTIPRHIVESLGWRRGERIKVDMDIDTSSIEMTRRTEGEVKEGFWL